MSDDLALIKIKAGLADEAGAACESAYTYSDVDEGCQIAGECQLDNNTVVVPDITVASDGTATGVFELTLTVDVGVTVTRHCSYEMTGTLNEQ